MSVGRATTNRGTATARVQDLQSEALEQDQQLGGVIEGLWRLKAKVANAKSRATFAETRTQEMVTKNVELCGLTEHLIYTVAEERAHLASFVEAEMLRFCRSCLRLCFKRGASYRGY